MAPANSAIVLGVGPDEGLGAQLCKGFAREGLHVHVAGRTQESLEAVASDIVAAGGSAEAVVTDATSEADMRSLFARARDTLEVAIYNAGNNTPGKIADMEADYFEQSWRTGCFGGFLFGREAARTLLPRGGGTLLFTGASASMRGRAGFGAFSAAKGGLRNLAQALAKEVGPEGIHVGHVVVDGAIGGHKVKTLFPAYAEQKGEAGMISIQGIVDAFLFLHRQPRTAWSFEVDLRTAIESW